MFASLLPNVFLAVVIHVTRVPLEAEKNAISGGVTTAGALAPATTLSGMECGDDAGVMSQPPEQVWKIIDHHDPDRMIVLCFPPQKRYSILGK